MPQPVMVPANGIRRSFPARSVTLIAFASILLSKFAAWTLVGRRAGVQ